MKTVEEYHATGKELYDALRLNTFPVAVKYFKEVKVLK